MKINKAYKVELRPNNRQRTQLAQSAGCARFTYNWGLAQRIKIYQESKESTDAMKQHKALCVIKKEQFPWMYDVTKCAPQEALRNLDGAFKHFFRRVKNGDKPGFPRFKKKGIRDSFTVTTGSIYVTKSSIKLPKISGVIRLKEKGYIPVDDVKYLSFTLSKTSNRWFLSTNCEIDIDVPKETSSEFVGVDLGIKELATISDGAVFHNHNAYKNLERKLKRTYRERDRRTKGSSNRRKTIGRLQKIHYRIGCIRKDSLHKMTSSLVKAKPKIVVIEDLSVKNMLKNHKLSKALSNVSFGEARRQFQYKSQWYGSEIVVADRFFPSSKMCSSCGNIKDDLKLSDRTYHCECGLVLDRDLNAALNLKRYGEFHRSLSKNKACGEERFIPSGRCSSEKQEFNYNFNLVKIV